ncbi:hypothetical protein ACIPSE_22095 [Streptomyces sp. NPDC090106]|uniref:hypothetical protein n=1 Tax=Streptomyces sp. NPDC090106 TaxID=3365946 RepID=UPI0038214BF9
MAVDQLPGRVREFVNYLDALLARLDQGGGWCAVFWQRDPEGMRACLAGREVPPWDVVEALLHDLATEYGPDVAAPEADRARALHTEALAAYDARPGGRDALGDRLDVMLREQRWSAERQAELGHLLAEATTQEAAEALRLDLAWAHDDHERATARCAELRSRMSDLDRRSTYGQAQAIRRDRTADEPVFPAERSERPERREYADPVAGPQLSDPVVVARDAESPAGSAAFDPEAARVPKQRKRRRGSARFAGMTEEEAAPVAVPPAAEPVTPAPAAKARRVPRGARFAGAAAEPVAEERPEPRPAPPSPGTDDARQVAGTVEGLVRLRRERRSGEAHALLVDAAHGPAARFPLLAAELQRAGLGADWATLLWEAASLPADRLVAAADALAGAGRGPDAEQILRQGVVRPAEEIGGAVLGLVGEGRRREVRALLDAYVRVRTPEEAARSAAPGPRTLVPLLLEAARGISEERRWDLAHALRVAGFPA